MAILTDFEGAHELEKECIQHGASFYCSRVANAVCPCKIK
jgi:hypothetical protein